MVIGKSMSLCVRDILKGIVSLDQVVLIEAGTMVSTCDRLKELIKWYQEVYWFDWSLDKCTDVVETLLFTQRLHQERILTADNSHLTRSIGLHEDRFGVDHFVSDIKWTFTSENEDAWTHVNGPVELGSHWIAVTNELEEEKKEPTEAEMDEWFMGEGVNMLDKLHNAAKTQGRSFTIPHSQEELDALPNSTDYDEKVDGK